MSTYINSVWDTVKGGYVEWKSENSPDTTGLLGPYPGPGDFETDTSNFRVISSFATADTNLFHTDVAGEIASLDQKVAPVAADKIPINDSEDYDAIKYIEIGDLPGGSGTDPNAVHTNVSEEIFALSSVTLAADDVFLVEDKSDSYSKGQSTISGIPHQSISGAGTNDHTAIDSHLGSTSNPHSVSKAQVGLTNVTDDAQLKRAAGDFSSFSQKLAPVSADVILLEDSEDDGEKKYAEIGDLPGGSGGLTADEVRQVVMSTCGGL